MDDMSVQGISTERPHHGIDLTSQHTVRISNRKHVPRRALCVNPFPKVDHRQASPDTRSVDRETNQNNAPQVYWIPLTPLAESDSCLTATGQTVASCGCSFYPN